MALTLVSDDYFDFMIAAGAKSAIAGHVGDENTSLQFQELERQKASLLLMVFCRSISRHHAFDMPAFSRMARLTS